MTVFSIGPITFNNDVADADGIKWFGYVDGWDTLENRIEDLVYPAFHGGLTTANLYNPRQMTVFGVGAWDEESSSLYYTAKKKLNATTNALTQFADSPILITHVEAIDRQIECLRTSLRTTCKGNVACEFELTVRADDPRKYDATLDTLTTSGSAVNDGDIATYPTFTLTSAGAVTLSNGSQSVVALSSLPSGTVIDFYRMTVTNGATDYFGNMSVYSEFFGLAPGANAVTSTVAGTWAWRSAWL